MTHLYHRCRESDIILIRRGDELIVKARKGVTLPIDDLRRCKAELLAMLNGDYLYAALELIRREVDPDRQADLAYQFDERVAICELEGGSSRGEAEKVAYLELVKGVANG